MASTTLEFDEGTSVMPAGSLLFTGEVEILIGDRRVVAEQVEDSEPGALPVSFERLSDGSWIAEDLWVGQFGEGASPEEALRDLIESLVEYRELLHEEEQFLSARLRGQLEFLAELVH